MQRVDHRIASRLLFGITGRQKDDRVAVNDVAFEIALQRLTVNLDVFHRHRLRTRNHRRHNCLDLRCNRRSQCKCA